MQSPAISGFPTLRPPASRSIDRRAPPPSVDVREHPRSRYFGPSPRSRGSRMTGARSHAAIPSISATEANPSMSAWEAKPLARAATASLGPRSGVPSDTCVTSERVLDSDRASGQGLVPSRDAPTHPPPSPLARPAPHALQIGLLEGVAEALRPHRARHAQLTRALSRLPPRSGKKVPTGSPLYAALAIHAGRRRKLSMPGGSWSSRPAISHMTSASEEVGTSAKGTMRVALFGASPATVRTPVGTFPSTRFVDR